MRRVLHGDLTATARALLSAPPARRAETLARIFSAAEAADAFRRSTGRAHPLLGTGSLMSAALARPCAREPFLEDPDYAACMSMVLAALIERAAG